MSYVPESRTGEGVFEMREGQLTLVQPTPMTDFVDVGLANHELGGGGLFVNQAVAAKYNMLGSPGILTFTDAADLRKQLSKSRPVGLEYQIATNGARVMGLPEHGSHAQTVSLDKGGQIVFGNNWGPEFNNKYYSDSFINDVTSRFSSTTFGMWTAQVFSLQFLMLGAQATLVRGRCCVESSPDR